MLQLPAIAVFLLFLFNLALVQAGDHHTSNPVEARETARIGKYLVDGRSDILLITSDQLKPAWQDFAVWKTRTGRPTKIVTVAEIEDAYEGKDIQQKIRNCCLQHIELDETGWVILGGDSRARRGGHVPDRDSNHLCFYKYRNLPTDAYYVSEGNWDANHDEVYGCFEEDLSAVDYTNPAACIGRIPVRTMADVQAYTRKVIEYESRYPDGAFANRMVVACAVPHANRKLHTSCSLVSDCWLNGNVQQFFTDRSPWDLDVDGDYDLSVENWVALFNDRQAAKIHMHGHGLIQQWVLENESKATPETVELLQNTGAYPVMTTVSCFTGQFDAFCDPCVTEAMLRKDGGGAIAIIAPSREGIPVFDDVDDFHLMLTDGKLDGTTETLTRFWQYALENGSTIGEAFRAAKEDMEPRARNSAGYHFVLCELNLLGDPTLDIRARPVAQINANARLQSTADGFAEVAIEVESDGTVCLWNQQGWYETATVRRNEPRTFRVAKECTGSISIAVQAPNKNIWICELTP